MRFVLGVFLLLLPISCARSSSTDDRLSVVATVYPLQFVVDAVAGEQVTATGLTAAGAEPHDLELSPDQVGDLLEADLVVYIGAGFQPAVEDLVDDVRSGLDVLSVVEPLEGAEGEDPHVWLDPIRMIAIAEAVRERLEQLGPQGAESYGRQAELFQDELEELDRSFAEALTGCERDEIFVSHAAFGYLTDRYGLQQIGIAGSDPEAEPSPRRVQEVAEAARAANATTIFAERLVSDRIAVTVADEIGAEVMTLDPLEGPPPTGDYVSAMEDNRDALSRALGCS